MDSEATQRQLPMASLNITTNKFTERPAVEHAFLVENWHEIASVAWNGEW